MKQPTQSEVPVNESKHTKGEWAIGYGENHKALGIFTAYQLDHRTLDHPICLISPVDKVDERDLANAQRIVTAVNNYDETLQALEAIHDYTYGKGINPAAVPDMLEALKKLSKVVTMSDMAFHPANVQAKAAIAKATNSK